MPGQCYSCGTEFGVFKKEHGCKNCGYAFCNKCLHTKKIPVPRRNNEKHTVCFQCSRILSGEVKKEDTDTKYELPQAYIKRMEALKERESHGFEHKKHPHTDGASQTVPPQFRNLDKPDREIAMRLERLKESDKPKEKVTNADICSRLANLQGQPSQPEKRPVYQAQDRRLQGQQVDDLMDEIAAEIDIDTQTDPVKDIEKRLEHLRSDSGSQAKASVKDPDENNLDKKTVSNPAKDGMYKKNIASSCHDDSIDMDEIQRLMERAAAETEMDAQKALSGMQEDQKLMERLKELQKKKQNKESNEANERVNPNPTGLGVGYNDDSDSEEDEDVAAQRIIQRFLEESKIDDNVRDSGGSQEKIQQKRERIAGKGKKGKASDMKPNKERLRDDDDDDDDDDDGYEDTDELPYCCICTEDAVTRCRDCDMDLYCHRCFRECHQEMDISGHRTIPYKAPKGYH